MTATTERPDTAVPERPPRSVPRVNFTDAEAGAKEFPDSSAGARRYNYYVSAKRKQTHYEDVTVEVQPDHGTTCPRAGSTASPTGRPATR
jgi:propane 2-monooxygenase small subunit